MKKKYPSLYYWLTAPWLTAPFLTLGIHSCMLYFLRGYLKGYFECFATATTMFMVHIFVVVFVALIEEKQKVNKK